MEVHDYRHDCLVPVVFWKGAVCVAAYRLGLAVVVPEHFLANLHTEFFLLLPLSTEQCPNSFEAVESRESFIVKDLFDPELVWV